MAIDSHSKLQTTSCKVSLFLTYEMEDKNRQSNERIKSSPMGFVCQCRSYLCHRVQPKALLVLHLINLKHMRSIKYIFSIVIQSSSINNSAGQEEYNLLHLIYYSFIQNGPNKKLNTYDHFKVCCVGLMEFTDIRFVNQVHTSFYRAKRPTLLNHSKNSIL